jgi:ATP-dependent RNA helicase DDX42
MVERSGEVSENQNSFQFIHEYVFLRVGRTSFVYSLFLCPTLVHTLRRCRIAIGRTGASSEHVDQHVMVLPNRYSKEQWLKEMIPILSPLGRCIVFVASRADCDVLTQSILESPLFAAGDTDSELPIILSIHGDKDQRDRNQAISQFKKQPNAILIATDVASRGLDVAGIMTVINFDAAKNLDSYVHRVGRAGRLQKDEDEHQRGVAYTLLTEKNADFALTLVESFEREGRAVSQELMALSQKSKRFGGGRQKNSKVGLGFGNDEGDERTQRPTDNYYGPSAASATTTTSTEQSLKKKSRWG